MGSELAALRRLQRDIEVKRKHACYEATIAGQKGYTSDYFRRTGEGQALSDVLSWVRDEIKALTARGGEG